MTLRTLFIGVALIGLGACQSGCASAALGGLTKNGNCTTKVSGEAAFGSITPTGKVKFSAVCKTGASEVKAADVANPPAVSP
jgi:hypothetical protein